MKIKNKKNLVFLMALLSIGFLGGCATKFKAERVDADKSDAKALTITDRWVARDTEEAVRDIVASMQKHRGFQQYMAKAGKRPKLFVGDVQNLTADPYFPINDINDEFLTKLSESGDFVLIDAQAREAILKEITYQNDGMVDAATAKKIGKQTGADLIIFGNVYMRPEVLEGKKIQQYNVNVRLTEIETAEEVGRFRFKTSKYSERSGSGW